MYAAVNLLILLGAVGQLAYNQPTHQPLPEGDYDVFTVIIDHFSKCTDEKYAFRRGDLLLINSLTVKRDRALFRFNFANAQQELSFRTDSTATFYKEPDWNAFITSIDTNRFNQYELNRPLMFTCRQFLLWTPEKEAYYFGKETQHTRGYFALQNDIKNFGAIIHLSNVAYSTNRQKALCYYATVSGSRDGAGHLVFLEKVNGYWEIVGNVILWVS